MVSSSIKDTLRMRVSFQPTGVTFAWAFAGPLVSYICDLVNE